MMKELDKTNAIDPDVVSGYILKECTQEMAEPIYDTIIDCSLRTGKIHKECKRTDKMPIYKNGNKEEPFNHRPVSLISTVREI